MRALRPRLGVALNLGARDQTLDFAALGGGRIALTTQLDRAGEALSGALTLGPDEGAIVVLSEQRPKTGRPAARLPSQIRQQTRWGFVGGKAPHETSR